MENLFQISGGGLVPISTEGKNDLPVGTILQLNGYSNPRYVISKNMGITAKYPGHGARYICVNPDDLGISQKDASELKFISEKRDGRIQTYITDEKMPLDEVELLYQKAEQKATEKAVRNKEAAEKTQALIENGKAILAAKKPAWAKAAIVACQEFDDCDLQTDYFHTKEGPLYILAWSKHTRDIFSEMRKAAANMPETVHLAKPSDVNSSGDKKTDDNKEWWTPADEHREKYSMGAGYYLKAAQRYSTGWKVEKHHLKYCMDNLYLSAGQGRYMVPEKQPTLVSSTISGGNGKPVVSENEERGGIEVKFNAKPAPEIIDSLKSHGFRWSRFQGLWWAKNTEARKEFALAL